MDVSTRLDMIEMKIHELDCRISKLESQPGNVPKERNGSGNDKFDDSESEHFQQWHGALFRRQGWGYEKVPFCKFCKVPLYAKHDIDLFKCPKCGKSVEFNRIEVPCLLEGLTRS